MLFYYYHRHIGVFDNYMADAVFEQPFYRAKTARANNDGIAMFFAAAFNNFRRRAAADNQNIRTGNFLRIN